MCVCFAVKFTPVAVPYNNILLFDIIFHVGDLYRSQIKLTNITFRRDEETKEEIHMTLHMTNFLINKIKTFIWDFYSEIICGLYAVVGTFYDKQKEMPIECF